MRFITIRGHSTPSGLSNWGKGAGLDQHITGISLTTPGHARQDALIGFFIDKRGRQYFMLQNLYRAPELTARAATSSITIDFRGELLPVRGTVYRLDRASGKSVEVKLINDNKLYDSLPGGTADLYSYVPFEDCGSR